MKRGDEMRRDAEPSAVRVLPSDGFDPVVPPPEPPSNPRRWFVPIAIATAVLAVFFVATRPSSTAGDAAALTTIPPSLSEFNADQIDIATPRTGESISDEWIAGEFDPDARVNSLFRWGGAFVAVGSTPEGGQAWRSGNGSRWSPVGSLEIPESAKTSLDHAAPWQGNLVVLGSVDDQVGLWVTNGMTRWEFHGPVESMGSSWISAIAAGSELLAISDADQTVQGWSSGDGLEWRPLGRLPLLEDAESIETLAATDEWFFAGGVDCGFDKCSPVIYRSSDGLNWEPTAGDLPDRLSAEVGIVADIAVAADGLVAVGTLGRHVAIWRSDNGAEWDRIAAEDAAFSHVPVAIELLATRAGDNPVATISLDGDEHQITVGSEIVTDNGPVQVDAITDSYIIVGTDESRRRVSLNAPTELRAWSRAWQIVTEGPRLVVAGDVLGDFNSSPVVWTSVDSGTTWERTFAPANGVGLFGVAVAGHHVVTLGESMTSTPGLWRTSWETTVFEEAATNAIDSYLEALDQYDTATLIELLPATNPSTNTPRFEIPSLGLTRHEWWDTDSGILQPDRVAATVSYLRATNMAVDHGDCRPSVSLGATDRVNVTCEFRVDSDLLSILGITQGRGDIQAVIAGNELVSVGVITSPTDAMWKTFGAGIVDQTETGIATMFAKNESGADVLAPTFDGTTAPTHLNLAREFVAGLLRPGETRTVETAFGTMEWTWIDRIDLPVFALETVAWSRLGFVATGRGVPDQHTQDLSVWISENGVDWVETKAPNTIDSIWGLQPFGDGVAGQGWSFGQPSIVVFDGLDWTVLDLPTAEAGGQDIVYAAANQDRMLAISGAWREESGPSFGSAWIVDKDLELTEVSLPPLPDDTEIDLGLTANDTGFILSASSIYNSRNLAIWHTTDGFDWTLIVETVAIEDASYLWNLQQHRLQYFVVGDGMETRCTTDGAGEVCESVIGLWRSPDGAAWEQVLTRSGSPVSTYEIGSGELGLVAFGQPTFGAQIPRPVYLSADGQEWHQAGGLSMVYPEVDWWWINAPAVGGDTVVAVGIGYQEGVEAGRPFQLVGRVIDGSS